MQEWPAKVTTSTGRYIRGAQYNELDGDAWIADRSGALKARMYDANRRLLERTAETDRRWLITGLDTEGAPIEWLVEHDVGCGCGGTTDVDAPAEQVAALVTAAG